jgi:hypothetical protein
LAKEVLAKEVKSATKEKAKQKFLKTGQKNRTGQSATKQHKK